MKVTSLLCTQIRDVFIVSAKRTPIGSFMGALSSFSAPELASIAISASLKPFNSDVKSQIDEVFIGNVLTASVGQAPARQAAILSGISNSTPCTTINKVCASGLKSVCLASQTIALGLADICIAGGMESMSNTPFYIKRQSSFPYGGFSVKDGIVLDGLTDAYNNVHMGMCGEKVAKEMKISRQEQDNFATKSYQKAMDAQSRNAFKDEIVSVAMKPTKKSREGVFEVDEEVAKVKFDKIASLKPVFDSDGTITAANASKINDGACSIVLTSQQSKGLQLPHLARVVGFADAAVDPMDFPIAPNLSISKLLKLTCKSTTDISLWEINEAFSVVVLAVQNLLKLDPKKVNVNGGAVALGHPIGCSGARILCHLVHTLKKGEYGVASICNGGGGASSIMIEKLV